MENMNELEEMRRQIQALKDKLERQGVLNEQKVRRSIKSKVNSIDRWGRFSLVGASLACLLYIIINFQWDFSWAFIIFTVVLCFTDGFCDWYINHIDASNACENLRDTVRKLEKMKRYRIWSFIIGLCVAVPWTIWFFYESFGLLRDHFSLKYCIISFVLMFVGMVIGGVIALIIFFKMQRKNDDLIAQIKELENGENF